MNKYIQITAGRGPVECARVVALVAGKLLAELPGAVLSDSEPHNSEPGCFMSLTFRIPAEEVSPMFIRSWQGGVLWVATQDRFRPNHKRKNWFVGVNFFDEVELPEVKDSDIRYETCRSGGKGGTECQQGGDNRPSHPYSHGIVSEKLGRTLSGAEQIHCPRATFT